MRGKPKELIPWEDAHRLIPARAGKTCRVVVVANLREAHPRACGENLDPYAPETWWQGSSPRVRGKLKDLFGNAWNAGLIPARAGKTRGSSSLAYSRRAHPRACGENKVASVSQPHFKGSSPRVRGKRLPAGTSSVLSRAHPRACGENNAVAFDWVSLAGSSPRVRGKPASRSHRYGPAGLIPARAGKTPCGKNVPRRCGAHPRACGENAGKRDCTCSEAGSSPRVRGKPPYRQRARIHSGLIPARAGKTLSRGASMQTGRAHPRACGENAQGRISRTAIEGSSPRVRGKPLF